MYELTRVYSFVSVISWTGNISVINNIERLTTIDGAAPGYFFRLLCVDCKLLFPSGFVTCNVNEKRNEKQTKKI